jgi:DNA invertase Pin-like site-specific DNA recombinase
MGVERRSTRRSIGDGAKAIGVVRCSTSKQDIGAAAQRAEIERWARHEGINLVAIFEDIGVSGAAPLTERTGLLAALAAMKAEGVGKLVAVKRDRFARHRHTIADIERAVQAAGGVLVTTDGICTGEDSEAEELQSSFQDILAQMELRKIRARNKARAQACIEGGRTHGGYLPYGYRRQESGQIGRSGAVVVLEKDPHEQRVIAKMVELHRQGQSFRKISIELEREKLMTREGKPWQAMAIKRVLDRVA